MCPHFGTTNDAYTQQKKETIVASTNWFFENGDETFLLSVVCLKEYEGLTCGPFHTFKKSLYDWLRQVRATFVMETVFQDAKKRTVCNGC